MKNFLRYLEWMLSINNWSSELYDWLVRFMIGEQGL